MSTRAIEPRRRPFHVPWLILFGGLVALVLGAAAVVSPTRALFLVGGLIFVGITLRSLAAGVALFTFFIFFGQLPGVADASVSLVKAAGFVLVEIGRAHV